MSSEPSQANPVTTMPITEVVKWTKEGGKSRLFLPPIQRSVVWRNSQVINYWDSLLRGYPAGLMMVHRPKEGAFQARTSDGKTCEICVCDFQLFDGQQRLTAILLGLGEGQLKDCLRLWVDLGTEPRADSDLQFVLRISSTGQPFGYQPDAPNEKPTVSKRRDKAEEWMSRQGLVRLILGKCSPRRMGAILSTRLAPFPLQEITGLVQELGATQATATPASRYPAIPAEHLGDLRAGMSRALSTGVLFQLIDEVVVERRRGIHPFLRALGL